MAGSSWTPLFASCNLLLKTDIWSLNSMCAGHAITPPVDVVKLACEKSTTTACAELRPLSMLLAENSGTKADAC